jgi:hypothetical protein
LYVNQTDGTSWVYSASNGGQYKSYLAPASTEWLLSGTTTDAGSNKTNNISRSGFVAIGKTTHSGGHTLEIVGNQQIKNLATAGFGSGVGIEFNSNTGMPRFSFVNNGYISEYGLDLSFDGYFKMSRVGSAMRFYTTGTSLPVERFTILSNGNIGFNQSTPQYLADINGTARIQTTPLITSATRALVKDPTTGQICEQTISNIATKQMVRAAYNFNASLTTAGGTFVGFNNVSVNTVPSGFNASLGEFTAQTTGQYLVSANLATYSASLVPGNFIEVFVMVGGVSQGSFVTQIPQGGSANITAAGTMVVNATSGQIIKFNYSTSFNSSTHISGTHFSIVQL